jgi:hypothetical protein
VNERGTSGKAEAASVLRAVHKLLKRNGAIFARFPAAAADLRHSWQLGRLVLYH